MNRRLIDTVVVAMLAMLALVVRADDVDIYLKTDENRSTPPYLMFMVDYRPSVFSPGCGTVTACYSAMSPKAFVQLCMGRAAAGTTMTVPQKRALCTRYANDLADNGVADYSTY